MTRFAGWSNRIACVVLVSVLSFAATLTAQSERTSTGDIPAAVESDVFSIDAIITALYATVSGDTAQERDWDRFRSLFLPDARLIPTSVSETANRFGMEMWAVEDYVEYAAPVFRRVGFWENESHRVVERFENIAHVFSTYESRNALDGDVFQRGINSIQLSWDGERWWIVNIMWRGVDADFEIPSEYLPESKN